MSDYCKNCHYDYKTRFGEKACPFNSLYWNFIDKNKEKLVKNQRMAIPLSSWSKMNPEDKSKILNQAQIYLENVNSL
jgi:deoxyribodipyrimidine photolyase-related protein